MDASRVVIVNRIIYEKYATEGVVKSLECPQFQRTEVNLITTTIIIQDKEDEVEDIGAFTLLHVKRVSSFHFVALLL